MLEMPGPWDIVALFLFSYYNKAPKPKATKESKRFILAYSSRGIESIIVQKACNRCRRT